MTDYNNEQKRKTFLSHFVPEGYILLTEVAKKFNLCQPTVPKYLDFLKIPYSGTPKTMACTYLPQLEAFLATPLAERKQLLRRASCMQKYGVDSSSKAAQVKEKIKQTNLDKYGAPCCLQNEAVRDKAVKTLLDRYGVTNIAKSSNWREFQKRAVMTNIQTVVQSQAQDCYTTQELSTLLHHDRTSLATFLKQYPYTIITEANGLPIFLLPKQYLEQCKQDLLRLKQSSLLEKELVQFVKSVYKGEVLENTRKVIPPKELDIYLPEENLAIEFDGLYWHSSLSPKTVSATYHLEKTKACEEKGIRLIHVFEDDWVGKRAIVEDIIKQALGLAKNRLYARCCTVDTIPTDLYRSFLNDNHLQGYSAADVKLGLFYQGTLVECIGIKTKGTHSTQPELVRLCSKLDTNILGGFSKLLKHSGCTYLVSYVDRSTFSGMGYKKVGWKVLKENPPTYFYVKGGVRYPRYMFMRKNIEKKFTRGELTYWNPEETEEVNMLKNGFGRIWNCGTQKVTILQCS